jgi:hypothetical protein
VLDLLSSFYPVSASLNFKKGVLNYNFRINHYKDGSGMKKIVLFFCALATAYMSLSYAVFIRDNYEPDSRDQIRNVTSANRENSAVPKYILGRILY